jgi:hypothetical protein
MLSLILQLEHMDEGLIIRGGGGYSYSMRPIKMSYFCCHPRKYLLDWATSYFCYLMPKCNLNNMYAVCHGELP